MKQTVQTIMKNILPTRLKPVMQYFLQQIVPKIVKHRKRLLSVTVCLTLLFPLVAIAFAAEDGRFVKVTAYDVNIRAGAGTEHPVVDTADYGESFTVAGTSDGWYEVVLGPNRTGWISAALVREGGRFQTSNPDVQVVEAKEGVINVRGGASTSYDIVATISPGTTYPLLQTSGDWVQIRLSGERTGWVANWLVSVTETKAKTTARAERKKATVTAEALHVRQDKSTDSPSLGTLRQNEIVEVLDVDGEWTEIEYGAEVGYVASAYVLLPNQPAPEAAQPPQSVGPQFTLNEQVNIRSGPGTNFPVLQTGTRGTVFALTARSGQWYEIELESGQRAWVAGWLGHVSGAAEGLPERGQSLDNRLRGKTVVLDAGHGGIDVGAIGRTTGLQEKDANLALTRILYNKLLTTGAHVVLTRPDDRYLSLAERVNVAAAEEADAFLSLHYNTNQDDALSGTMTFYYEENGDDHTLAKAIQQELVASLGLPDLGARHGDYYVLRENPQPAVLIETAFLTHPGDEQHAQDPAAQERAAEGIFRALVAWLEQKTS